MRKYVISAISVVSVTLLLSLAFAGAPYTSTIQNGATITEIHNGQTFEMTSENVSVEVIFYEVSEEHVDGLVTKLSGNSGSFTIRWIDRDISTTIQLSNRQPEQLFGLEGGDGDKRETGEIN